MIQISLCLSDNAEGDFLLKGPYPALITSMDEFPQIALTGIWLLFLLNIAGSKDDGWVDRIKHNLCNWYIIICKRDILNWCLTSNLFPKSTTSYNSMSILSKLFQFQPWIKKLKQCCGISVSSTVVHTLSRMLLYMLTI